MRTNNQHILSLLPAIILVVLAGFTSSISFAQNSESTKKVITKSSSEIQKTKTIEVENINGEKVVTVTTIQDGEKTIMIYKGEEAEKFLQKQNTHTRVIKQEDLEDMEFSFNVEGGRCEDCQGEGTVKVEMQFMADIYLACESCKGKRFKDEILAIDGFKNLTTLLKRLGTDLEGKLSAFEVMWQNYVDEVCRVSPAGRQPFETQHPIYVLLEAEGCSEEQFQQAVFEQIEAGLVSDAAMASSGKDVADFWAIRDGVADLMSNLKGFATFDVGLPISKMKDFIAATDKALLDRFPTVQNLPLGHIADGNLHFLTWTGDAGDVQGIYDTVYDVVGQFGGTITAEHGVGMSKRKYLKLCRTDTELELMKLFKRTLDPNGILNPGRIFS